MIPSVRMCLAIIYLLSSHSVVCSDCGTHIIVSNSLYCHQFYLASLCCGMVVIMFRIIESETSYERARN